MIKLVFLLLSNDYFEKFVTICDDILHLYKSKYQINISSDL